MKRREFIKNTAYSTALLGSGVGPSFLFSEAHAAANPIGTRVLVNVMLVGGADLRHLIAPAYTGTPDAYADAYWNARETIHNVSGGAWGAAEKSNVWTNEYFSVDYLGQTFGINKKAAWLKSMFDQGHVAIVCNVKQSENRRHDHSQLIINSGDPGVANFNLTTSGWGGRLAEEINAANVVSMTSNVSVFSNGSDPTDLTAKIISAPDTRDIALSDIPSGSSTGAVLSRSLKAYYARRGVDLENDPHLATVIQHERALRQFGDQIKDALAGTSLPPALSDLFQGNVLRSRYFGQQIANIYDSFLAGQEMQFRLASLEYGGWDTHKDQKTRIENNFEDIFGTDKALDTLFTALDSDMPGVTDDLVFSFTTDFGRQLKSNGTNGTDHGKGNYMILVGKSVRGGLYGDIFPSSEISRFDEVGSDIDGLTSFERVLGEVCDWVHPGSGDIVFPGRQAAVEETNANIHNLFVVDGLYTVSGTVVTDEGIPLQGVSVSTSNGTNIDLTTTTNASGFYTQTDVPDGLYDITPTRAGYDLVSRLSESVNGSDVTVNFVATESYATSIYGQILTSAGTPAVGVSVNIANNAGFSTIVITDENGRFKQPVPGNEAYIVLPQSTSGYASINPNEGNIFTSVSSGNIEKSFTAVPVQPLIYGTIVTSIGMPAVGVSVDIANNIGFSTTVVTDAKGLFQQQVPDGTTYIVSPQSNSEFTSIGPNGGNIFVGVSGDNVEKNFTAVPANPIIYGIVLSTAGTPAARVSLQIANNIGFSTIITTDETGRYFQQVPDGTGYIVFAQANSNYTSIGPNDGSIFANVSGSDVEKNLTAVPVNPIIYGVILTTAGLPAANVSVGIVNNIGFSTSVITDANGEYFKQVPDGTTYIVNPQLHQGYTSIGPNTGNVFVGVNGSNVEKDFTAVPVIIGATGDVNGDGDVNTADVLLADRIALGNLNPTAEQILRGDVAPLINGVPVPDGVLNAADLLVIRRKALGLISF